MTWLWDDRMTEWHDDGMTGWQDDQMTTWLDDGKLRRRLTVWYIYNMKMQISSMKTWKYHKLVFWRNQPPRTDSPQQQILVILCKFSADEGNVERPEEGMGLRRVEELELGLDRPVVVARVARLELRHRLVVQVNWKCYNDIQSNYWLWRIWLK